MSASGYDWPDIAAAFATARPAARRAVRGVFHGDEDTLEQVHWSDLDEVDQEMVCMILGLPVT